MCCFKILNIFFLLFCVHLVQGDLEVHPKSSNNQKELGPCATPNSECMAINKCPELVTLLQKKIKTQQEVDLLRKSHCGFEGRKHAVCCPKKPPEPQPECYTPSGKPGQCIPLTSCEPLAKLLAPPVPEHALNYARRSVCTGPQPRSVCCGPVPDFTTKTAMCPLTVSALPPDPTGPCCGVDSILGDKIVGGAPAKIDQYPWLALIEYKKADKVKTLCGGALITGKYVLTAAHCVVGEILKSGRPTHVRLGEYDSSNEGPDCVTIEGEHKDCTDGAIRREIERKIPHPEYKPWLGNLHNDVALLRMNEMAPYTDFIRPICLPTEDMTQRTQPFRMTVAGWGTVGERTNRSTIKLHVEVPFVRPADCQPSYAVPERRETLWKGQLCAGGETGKDSCKGDSGGPLMYENDSKYILVGTVSVGNKACGADNIPGIYTNIFEYIPWINSNIVP